jgi:tetratricopeptide (TPR) repeat protein
MRPITRSRPVLIGLAVVVVAMAAIGFLPLFGGPGYESSLAAGLVLAFVVAVTAALAVLPEVGDRPVEVLSRALAIGALLAFAAWLTTIAHGFRVGFCDALSGSESFALGPGVGALLSGAWGAVAAELARRQKRPRLWAVALAILGPLASALFSVLRFYTSPMIFAYDPFVGYFGGTLYDTLIDFSGLVTYRAGSAATLLAAVILALHLRRDKRGALRIVWVSRPAVALLGVVAMSASLLANIFGYKLGHWQTAATIANTLGGRTEGARCLVVHPRTLRQDDVDRFTRDCDEHVAVLERFFGASGPHRITVFLFESSAQKGSLMGAADTYIAKPWRREIYVQAASYPHPVLGHELAHVVAGSFGRGPFKIAGDLFGLLPNPGLVEGVAVAAEPPEGDLLPNEWARAMKDLDLLPKLDHLFALGFLAENSSVAYTVSGAFVGWVREHYGADVMRAWYGGRDLAELTSSSWADLERRWRDDLGTAVLPAAARGVAKARFDRPAIFGRRCPHVVDACRARGDHLRGAGDYEGAIRAYEELLALDTHDDGTRLAIARARMRERGHTDEGLAAITRMAEDRAVARPVRDRAIEELGDLALAAGKGPEARTRYEDVLKRTLDEDQKRTLEIKIQAAGDDTLRPSIVALLIGHGDRGPDRSMAMELLGSAVVDAPRSGIAWYLLARQYANAGQYDEAETRLERALDAYISIPRVRIEAERLRMLVGCAKGDTQAALRGYAAYASHPEVSAARRGGARALVERCTGAPPPKPAYDESGHTGPSQAGHGQAEDPKGGGGE